MREREDLLSKIPSLESGIVPLVRIGLVRAEPVHVAPASDVLLMEIEDLGARLARLHAGRQPAEIEGLNPARALYRAFGVDPTRIRPSSEALLRRVLQGKPLPRILNAVDVCTLCSLEFLLPIGLYDVEALRGPVELRRGRPGESYPGIRKDDVHLEGRLVLADELGAFGNPTSDSLRTSVTGQTRSLWMVIFAPAAYPADRLATHVAFARSALERHTAGAGLPVGTWGTILP